MSRASGTRPVVHAWFIGPRGADPPQMTVAAFPGMYGSDVVALVDGEPDADTLTLVVVARPEDLVMRPESCRSPTPRATRRPRRRRWTSMTASAFLEVERRWAESDATLFVQREDGSGTRRGRLGEQPCGDRAADGGRPGRSA